MKICNYFNGKMWGSKSVIEEKNEAMLITIKNILCESIFKDKGGNQNEFNYIDSESLLMPLSKIHFPFGLKSNNAKLKCCLSLAQTKMRKET